MRVLVNTLDLELRQLIGRFDRVMRRYNNAGSAKVGQVVLAYGTGVGGGNDIHFGYRYRYVKRAGWFGRRIYHYYSRQPFAQETEWVNVKLLVKYKQEIATALEQVDSFYKQKELTREQRREARLRRDEERVRCVIGKCGK